MRTLFVLLVFSFVLLLCSAAAINTNTPVTYFEAAEYPAAHLPLDSIKLPPGFKIEVYAFPIPAAREIAVGDEGTVFVGSGTPGYIWALSDDDQDGAADRGRVIASNLGHPTGVAFKDGDLYFSDVSKVFRLAGIESQLDSGMQPELVFDGFPEQERHGYKFLAFGPDGRLYAQIGQACNVCDMGDPHGALVRLKPDFSGFDIVARGIRNSEGFDWSDKGELWFTDNGRDDWGHGNVEVTDNNPPCELNRIAAGSGAVPHFGFPHFHGNSQPDPDGFAKGYDAKDFVEPAQALGTHVAPLGMRFYDGGMFPAQYKNAVFIAEHGSWNRSKPLGARISMVRVDAQGKSQGYEVFAEGWQSEEGFRWGRPTDVEVMPDGSLLISDDMVGCVYRVTYSP